MFGLSETNIKAIQGVFSKHPNIEKVVLYGSRAKGNHKPNSDIDLVLFGEKLDLSEQFETENQIDDLLLPYKFDIVIYNMIQNPDLIEHIDRRGIVFYCND